MARRGVREFWRAFPRSPRYDTEETCDKAVCRRQKNLHNFSSRHTFQNQSPLKRVAVSRGDSDESPFWQTT